VHPQRAPGQLAQLGEATRWRGHAAVAPGRYNAVAHADLLGDPAGGAAAGLMIVRISRRASVARSAGSTTIACSIAFRIASARKASAAPVHLRQAERIPQPLARLVAIL
jgi:hypothetical protein